jgi:adenylate cyclase, class 2
MQEIEAKILEIDVEAVKRRLTGLGAQFDFSEEFFAIYFEDAEGGLGRQQQVLRLRKEGDVRLTFKAPHPHVEAGIRTREELEVTVGDFEGMRIILLRLGYVEHLKMRKIRTQYTLGDVHVVIDAHIDELAYIPPYLEIEAPSHAAVFEMAGKLGFAQAQLIDWSAMRVMEWYRERLNP